MDRRKFVKTLSVLAAPVALPTTGFAGNLFSAALSNDAEPLASPERIFNNDDPHRTPRIGVIAVGGAGGEVLSNLCGKLPHLYCSIAIDTFPGALDGVVASRKILLSNSAAVNYGSSLPLRLDAHRADDLKKQIAEAVSGLDIAFIVAGMGGAARTVISQLVAEVLREKRITAIAAAITPFVFEGQQRQRIAWAATRALGRITNAVVPISNELLAQSARNTGLLSPEMERALTAFASAKQKGMVWPSRDLAMQMTDALGHDPFLKSIATTTFERLYRGVTSPFGSPGLVTIDPEDLGGIMSADGLTALGYGNAAGAEAAALAAHTAISHPLLGVHRLRSASCILVSIEGPPSKLMKLRDVNGILKAIQHAVGDVDHEQHIVFGATYNEKFADQYRVCILAGGVLDGAMGFL